MIMTQTGGKSDRRAHPRHSVNVRVYVAQLGEISGALTRDLSAGGLFVETTFPIAVGSELSVRLIDPQSHKEIDVLCEVARRVEASAVDPAGLGLRFTNLDRALSERLRLFIAVVAKPASRQAPTAAPPQPPAAKPAPVSSPAAAASGPTVRAVDRSRTLDAVPVPNIEATGEGLEPLLVRVLAAVDGARTVNEIAREIGLSPNHIVTAFRELERLDAVFLQLPDSQG